jgi:hypothetical protein
MLSVADGAFRCAVLDTASGIEFVFVLSCEKTVGGNAHQGQV